MPTRGGSAKTGKVPPMFHVEQDVCTHARFVAPSLRARRATVTSEWAGLSSFASIGRPCRANACFTWNSWHLLKVSVFRPRIIRLVSDEEMRADIQTDPSHMDSANYVYTRR